MPELTQINAMTTIPPAQLTGPLGLADHISGMFNGPEPHAASSLSHVAPPSLGSSTPSASPTDPLAVAMVLGGVAILAVIFTLSARKKLVRRANTPSPAREQYERLKRQAEPGDDADVANARLHERAQQLAAVLDNKAARLEQLIADVDRRIESIEQAATAERTGEQPLQQANSATGNDVPVETERVVEPKDGIQHAIPPQPSQRHDTAASLDPLTRSVYQLSDAGLSSVQVAQRLDEQIGKVELILALRPARQV